MEIIVNLEAITHTSLGNALPQRKGNRIHQC